MFRVYLDELCVYIEDSERGIGEKSGDRVCRRAGDYQLGRACVCVVKKRRKVGVCF